MEISILPTDTDRKRVRRASSTTSDAIRRPWGPETPIDRKMSTKSLGKSIQDVVVEMTMMETEGWHAVERRIRTPSATLSGINRETPPKKYRGVRILLSTAWVAADLTSYSLVLDLMGNLTGFQIWMWLHARPRVI